MKTNKLTIFTIALCCALLLTVFGLTACEPAGIKLADADVYFASKDVISSDFAGIGVEWGAYEDTTKLRKDYLEVTTELVDKLNPKLVRCMVSYEWFLRDFDDKGNDDLTDDTWGFDFDNKWMTGTLQVLNYCQNHGVQVAFGCWNVIGSPAEDEYGMIKNASADIRWAKISADVMDYLVNRMGYSCIKWYVSTNEPNYAGAKGSSKNAYNTFDKWAEGVRNVRVHLDEVGLTNVSIIGGDTTGYFGSGEYMTGIANDLLDVIDNYGIHLYTSNYDIDNMKMSEYIGQLRDTVRAIDGELSNEHKLIIWEGGLLDGKNATTDCNAYIGNFSYGIRMADYTIQSLASGVNGVCYWDLDDAMYFMYTESGTNPKEWGMFSTLATAPTIKQEIRPWYHSTTLIGNLLTPGSTLYRATTSIEDKNLRMLASVGADGKQGGILAVNRGMRPISGTFMIGDQLEAGEKTYVYLFNEKTLRIDKDGYVVPNYVLDASLNEGVSIEIPANSMVAVANHPLVNDCDESTAAAPADPKGSIGEFDIKNVNAGSVFALPTFEWTAAGNASYYSFELCSTTEFNQTDDVYVKKSGIVDTSIRIVATPRQKNETYYWRVTAHNADGSRAAASIGSFYLTVPETSKVVFPIEYADEWTLHQVGSYADISIDNSDFFGNGHKSLRIAFDVEDTNQGIPESDGWIVVTNTNEMEVYGVDAIKFDFYYGGDDANVLVRIVDADNEYWQAQVQVAKGARQSIIMRFDQFTLRTASGTTIANEVFDYNYIKSIDITFEKSFGDGIALISDLCAVRYADYRDLFIDHFDFSQYEKEDFIFDNHAYVPTFDADNNRLTLTYNGINGYAFAKLPVNVYLQEGDAFKLTLGYSGATTYDAKANILIRLIEEDKDRWVFTQRASLCRDGLTLVVPFKAFTLSEYNGDGARQFYFIQQLQFGLQNVYGSGSVSFENIEVVKLADEQDNLYNKTVDSSGIIDNFEDYDNAVQLYYNWQMSDINKDEALSVDDLGIYGNGNLHYGVFSYKSDMMPASYGMKLSVPAGFHSISLCVKDDSVLYEHIVLTHLHEVSAKMLVTLYSETGEAFTYAIDKLAKDWTNYVISFDDMNTNNPNANALASEQIVGMQIDLQYFYYDASGKPYGVYMSNNKVLLDDICFAADTTTAATPIVSLLTPDVGDNQLCTVDNFEAYLTDGELQAQWDGNGSIAASHDDGHSMQLAFVSTTATSLDVNIDTSVKAKAICLDMNADGDATVYIDVQFLYAGVLFTYRATLVANTGWNQYIVGFDKFTKVSGTGGTALSSAMVPNITSIAISATNTGAGERVLNVDNLKLTNKVSSTTKTTTPIED